MKTKNLLVSLVLGLGLMLGLLWVLNSWSVFVAAAPAAELHVCLSGCTYSSVQDAVDAAADGDVIKVAAGTYTGVNVRPRNDITTTGVVTQMVYVSKTVTIQGGYTTANWTTSDPETNPTTLDAQGQGRVFYVTGGISATIEEFNITGGDAAGLGGWFNPWMEVDEDGGGGIYVISATATISNNRVFSNTAENAGGVLLNYNAGTFSGNTVADNEHGGLHLYHSAIIVDGNIITGTHGHGAGIELMFDDTTVSDNFIAFNDFGGMWTFLDRSVITGNIIISNTSSEEGAGVCLQASFDSMLINNEIKYNISTQGGGGVRAGNGARATLVSNTISFNTAISGGGVYIYDSAPTLIGNTIEGNTATDKGGGISVSGDDPEDPDLGPTLRGNTIISNTADQGGGGLWLQDSDASLIDENTFRANTTPRGGGGVDVMGSQATFKDNHFIANISGDKGGGLSLCMFSGTVGGNTIISNTADLGGGVYLFGGGLWENNVVADNHASSSGGGLCIQGSLIGARMLHNTIVANSSGDGSGIYVDWADWVSWYSTVFMTNTIVSDHDVGIRVTGGNTMTVDSILWYNTPTTISQFPTATVSVQNEVTGDPAFADPGNDDYHIGAGSLARDAGVDSGVSTDMDGQVRPMGLAPDLGADEYPGVYLAIAKQSSLVRVSSGQLLTYTVVVTSAGTDSATGVVVTDTLNGWQRVVGVSSSVGGCTIPDAGWGGNAVCNLGTLVPGATVAITLTSEVSVSAVPGQMAVNTAVVKANEIPSSSAQVATYVQDCHVRINASATEYGTVQAAVDAASSGDVVKVAGTCLGADARAGLSQQVYVDKSITVRGGYTTTNWTTSDPKSNPTTLDALGEGRVVYIAGDISPAIESLRITGGDASGLGGLPWGWDAGGGVYVVTATATISNNRIYGNTVGNGFTLGGGVYLENSAGMVIGNTIRDNTAGWGGGVQTLWASATLSGNMVLSNTVSLSGGGVSLWGDDNMLISNIVRGNTAQDNCGGVSVGGEGAELINNIVADNHADGSGGGLCIDGPSRFWHTTVAHNTAGDGSGIYVTKAEAFISVAFTNTILADQIVGISVTGGNTVTVNGVLWHNVYDNVSQSPTATVNLQNQHWGNAAFVYPAGGDYHIDANSTAIDRGVNAGIGTDIDGESRPIGTGYDLGADEYPCDGVSNVRLSRMPSDGLFTGNKVLFTADADGSTPFTYTWTLNGGAVGENRSTFEHIFSASGTYTVGVTVASECGQDSDEMIVGVADPAPQQPDLSQSYKSVNLTSVEGGDVLTYTLVLRNRSAVSATAILTDVVPDHTTYIPSSAQASSGAMPTAQDGQVCWSGQVITGTPVIIQFAVEVTTTGLAVGDVITNVATLDDGLGNVMTLDAQSTYNPGYELSINDGALYTDIPTVTLRYSWNVADDIIYVKFSNDGGFGTGSSGWIPVDAMDPTYAGWVLDTYGDLRTPRTVYAKFRDSSGAQYGPFQDYIVYDPGEPQVTGVEVITQTGGGSVESVAGQNVIVRVTSSDDNSGAGVIQISHGVDFAQYSEFAVTGPTTDIPWVLQSSGEVYVRVVDRAGNVSEVESEQGPPKYDVYLPLVIRNH